MIPESGKSSGLSRTLVSSVSALVLLALTLQAAAGVCDRIAPIGQRTGDAANVRQIADAIVRRFEHTRRRQAERPALVLRAAARPGADPEFRTPIPPAEPPLRLLEFHLLSMPPPGA